MLSPDLLAFTWGRGHQPSSLASWFSPRSSAPPPFLPHSHLPQYNPCPLNPVLTSGSQRMWTNMLAPSPAVFSSYPCLLPTPLSASCPCVPLACSLLTPWQCGECGRRASTRAESFLHVTLLTSVALSHLPCLCTRASGTFFVTNWAGSRKCVSWALHISGIFH